MEIKNKIELKRFLGWINNLPPQKLWQPNHTHRATSQREFSDEVKAHLEKLL